MVLIEQKNEAKFNYAFALAIERNLLEIQMKLNNQIMLNSENDEEMVNLQDTVVLIDQITHFSFRKIKEYYKEQDISQSKSLSDSLVYKFDKILSGSRLSSFDLSKQIKTEDLITEIENGDYKKVHFNVDDNVESELGVKFGSILNSTFNIHRGSLGNISELDDFDNLSIYTTEYLKSLMNNLSDVFDLNQALKFKIEALVERINFRNHVDFQIEQLYSYFKIQLTSYLQIFEFDSQRNRNGSIVSKLREQGNNLMANQAFAQAIKVYTNALDIASNSNSGISQILTNRAIAFIGLNCFSEAISDLNEAVKADRTFTPAWTQLGYCHLYMGTSLIALKSYLMALKSAVGEILPSILFNEKNSVIEEYQKVKIQSVLPQFIQRLSQSIALTERRANQQRENSTEIKLTISEVKRILNRLSSTLESDSSYFVYTPSYNDNAFRSIAERANRVRPNILSQDVAQNMLANNGMEAEVTLPRNPLEGFGIGTPVNTTVMGANNLPANNLPANPVNAENRNELNSNVSENSPSGNAFRSLQPNAAPTGVRDLLNDFGDLFEGRIEIQTGSFPNAGPSNTENEQEQNRHSENTPRDLLRGILPRNLGSIISRSLGGQSSSSNQNSRSNDSGSERGSTSNSTDTAQRPSSSSGRTQTHHADEDVEMPQVPEDLD